MSRTPRPEQDPEFLSTLERGLRVLRAFNRERPEMSLSEAAAVTDLSPAVARRCLHTLVRLGYVAQHGRRFILRPEVLVKGGDWAEDTIVGAADVRSYGGRVFSIPFTHQRSTSAVLEKIRRS